MKRGVRWEGCWELWFHPLCSTYLCSCGMNEETILGDGDVGRAEENSLYEKLEEIILWEVRQEAHWV